jgi:RNA polymerase sigma-70 factor (ECF subfamily)
MMVNEDYRRVMAGMQGLAREERDILSLVVSSDLPYRDIARIAGTSEANVKVRVHRARVKLKKIMDTGDI